MRNLRILKEKYIWGWVTSMFIGGLIVLVLMVIWEKASQEDPVTPPRPEIRIGTPVEPKPPEKKPRKPRREPERVVERSEPAPVKEEAPAPVERAPEPVYVPPPAPKPQLTLQEAEDGEYRGTLTRCDEGKLCIKGSTWVTAPFDNRTVVTKNSGVAYDYTISVPELEVGDLVRAKVANGVFVKVRVERSVRD